MTSQPGKQTVQIDILSNISRTKENQAMKLGQLMKYFSEKSYSKYGEKTIPRPFSEKPKLSISLDQQSKAL